MVDKKRAVKEYKETVQPMGVYQIRNTVNGKIYLASSKNLRATVNRFGFSPETHLRSNSKMREDLKAFGADSFVLEILDQLETDKEPGHDYTNDLAELEQLWLEKVQPFADRGYN